MRPSKNTIKYIKSLHRKKFRQKYENFIVEGDKMLQELLQGAPSRIERLFLLPDWAEHQAAILGHPLPAYEPVDATGLKQLSSLTTPQAGLAVVRQIEPGPWPEPIADKPILYLDGIQDPGNLGAILRIADWFAIPEVWCATGTVDVYSPKVVQAAMGALLRVPVRQNIALTDLPTAWRDVPVWGADMVGKSIHTLDPQFPLILVVGSEGAGIRPETQPFLTHTITIPAPAGSGAESLNAAVATGIICATLLK